MIVIHFPLKKLELTQVFYIVPNLVIMCSCFVMLFPLYL